MAKEKFKGDLKKINRVHSMEDKKRVSKDYCDNIAVAIPIIYKKYDIKRAELEFLLWGNKYQFFTIDYAAGELDLSRSAVEIRRIYPLRQRNYMFNYFNKLAPRTNAINQAFEYAKHYKVRYALTEEGRLVVRDFYREMEKHRH